MNRNVVITISYNECKDVLLNKKYLGYWMNRIQIKDRKIGTYELNEISLPCYEDKIYIKDNGWDRFALGYQS